MSVLHQSPAQAQSPSDHQQLCSVTKAQAHPPTGHQQPSSVTKAQAQSPIVLRAAPSSP
ncbi:hypothetical protein PF011_g20314 [Phytophthora fragariae]|uniref:Uncharacterized protein n=1 Tax=Phytophthora fragariae TaxID=53985 RepID=A0A6A3IUY1_9STRA|nr:hypothetical protein PF011_g20314 [Phytophthora fragariae]